MRYLATLIFVLAGSLFAAEFSVPLLELKQEGQEWHWFRGETRVDGDRAEMLLLFADFSRHTDLSNGWCGKSEGGFSDNLLVVHGTGAAPMDEIGRVLAIARYAGIRRAAVAAAEEISTPPDKSRNPDTAKLDPAYVLIDTYAKPDGKGPKEPRPYLDVYCNYDTERGGGDFIVSSSTKTRTTVADSFDYTGNLVYLPGESALARKMKVENRARLKQAIVTELERQRAKVPDADTISISGFGVATPWVFAAIAARAAATMNDERIENNQQRFEIRWPVVLGEERDPDESLAKGPTERRWSRPFSPKFQLRRPAENEERPNDARMQAALEWLENHQSREGFWSATTFADDSTRINAKRTRNLEFVKPGEPAGDIGWEASCDVGLTGLALLAFAGAGHDHKAGTYRATCRQAVLYLRKVQDNDGCFGAKEDDHFVYNHAICTMAMAEIYGLSGDQVIKPIVDKACEFILKAQNPGLGWRYGVQPGVNDSSITGWMVLALKSAKLAGIDMDVWKSFSDAAAWFQMITIDVNGYPKVGYDSPGSNNARLRSAQEYEHNPTVDAIYIMSMLSMGQVDLDNKTVRALARGCIEKEALPRWDHHKIDFYYWYYASLATHQVGGTVWETWDKAMTATLTENQRGFCDGDKANKLTSAESLDEHGSWDPVGAWGSAGGRVYATAMGALILQTPYRYERIEK